MDDHHKRYELKHGHRETLPDGDRYVLHSGDLAGAIHSALGFMPRENYQHKLHIVIVGCAGIFSVSARTDKRIKTFERIGRKTKKFNLDFEPGTTILTTTLSAPPRYKIIKNEAVIIYPDQQVGLYEGTFISLSITGAGESFSPPSIKLVTDREAERHRTFIGQLNDELEYLIPGSLAKMERPVMQMLIDEFKAGDRRSAISANQLLSNLKRPGF